MFHVKQLEKQEENTPAKSWQERWADYAQFMDKINKKRREEYADYLDGKQ